MNDPFDLARVERWMQAVIMHPGGVHAGLTSALAQGEIQLSGSDELPHVINPSRAMSSAARLEIYAHAYSARLLECLREEFPVLCRTMGPELFDEFAFGYLQAYPSRSYTLARLGAEFPRFLAESLSTESTTAQAWLKFFVELARLERTFSEVFDGPGVEELSVLSEDQLRALAPESWAEARLRPAPCLRLLEFEFPVNEFYSAARAEQDAPPFPEPRPTRVAISRRDYVVRRQEVPAEAWPLLQALVQGSRIGEALALALTGHSADAADSLVSQVQRWFFSWARDAFFVDIDLPLPGATTS
jgi:hypothetical protein